MLKKIWNNPVTWGDYAKFAGVSMAISLIISAVYYLKMAADWGWWPFSKKDDPKKIEDGVSHDDGYFEV